VVSNAMMLIKNFIKNCPAVFTLNTDRERERERERQI
jgi:hypothetical protein